MTLRGRTGYQVSNTGRFLKHADLYELSKTIAQELFLLAKLNATNILAVSNILENGLKFSASKTGLSNITQAGS